MADEPIRNEARRAPARCHTDGERRAFLRGFGTAVELAQKRGLSAAVAELAFLVVDDPELGPQVLERLEELTK